jgi:hypothetical protein
MNDNHIKAEIVADSLNPKGVRLTSWVLEYPRFIHSELMTHRVFSKNAASSRAIPVDRLIQQVIDNPALPVFFGANRPGMQSAEELDDVTVKPRVLKTRNANSSFSTVAYITDRAYAKHLWLEARDVAIESVRGLNALGLHKQIANRVLEPWFNIRVIMTGTEHDNFFALRTHKDAQPEFQNLAKKMKVLYDSTTPQQLKENGWHIPFGDKVDEQKLDALLMKDDASTHMSPAEFNEAKDHMKRKIAIARCARVSYLNYEGKDDYLADITLCDRLFGSVPRHLSPTEHVAMALDSNTFIGNFRGFRQYRKLFAGEDGSNIQTNN